LRLLFGGCIIVAIYLWMLLFLMGQKAVYFDLFKELQGALSMKIQEKRAG
jgi:hypothetical protein